MRRTADQLAAMIAQIAKMDLAELGETDTIINTKIFDFMSLAMHKLAKLANQVVITEPTAIVNGAANFLTNGQPVSVDMFQPIRIMDTTGLEVPQRQSYSSPDGWFWEAENREIHFSGVAGMVSLHYVKYPAWITTGTQTPEFPPSGYYSLIFETVSLIKQSKNFYEESEGMLKLARESYGPVLAASQAGTATSNTPTDIDVKQIVNRG